MITFITRTISQLSVLVLLSSCDEHVLARSLQVAVIDSGLMSATNDYFVHSRTTSESLCTNDLLLSARQAELSAQKSLQTLYLDRENLRDVIDRAPEFSSCTPAARQAAQRALVDLQEVVDRTRQGRDMWNAVTGAFHSGRCSNDLNTRYRLATRQSNSTGITTFHLNSKRDVWDQCISS